MAKDHFTKKKQKKLYGTEWSNVPFNKLSFIHSFTPAFSGSRVSNHDSALEGSSYFEYSLNLNDIDIFISVKVRHINMKYLLWYLYDTGMWTL